MKLWLTEDRFMFFLGLATIISVIGLVLSELDIHFLVITLVIILGLKTNKTIVGAVGIVSGWVFAYLYATSSIGYLSYLLTGVFFSGWIGYGLEKMRFLLQTDSLTGALNRKYFFRMLEGESNRSNRYDQLFSLVILDLDDFKQVNDTYGHLIGDRVLQEVSNMIQKGIRSCDTLGRIGGEEFGVILPNTKAENALLLMKRLQHAIKGSPSAQQGIKLSFSAGVAECSKGISVQELYNRADQALYHAKVNKNCVKVYNKIRE